MIEPRTLAGDARLLHIGFRKCGTTGLQQALRAARPELAALGIAYPGHDLNHTTAALAVTGRTNGWVSLGAKPRTREKWDELVETVRDIGPDRQIVIDSEFFDIADEATIRTVADGLGGDRVHVLATVRPLNKVLPSAWQQNVQFGVRRSYDEWLDVVLNGDESMKTYRGFWERHSHGDVLARWASVLGPERLTLIVLDERDRQLPFRTVDKMLGVPAGTLKDLPERANRSLTGAEAELIRRVNVELMSRDVTWEEYSEWIRRGAAHQMWWKRTPGPDEPRVRTPGWALERAAEITADLPERIEGLGIEIVGDLTRLATPMPPAGADEAVEGLVLLPIDAAVQALVGACLQSRQLRPAPVKRAAPKDPTARDVARLAAKALRGRWRRLRR
ncbi:MAG TPA: hypothetical protein VHW92_01370 [Mycobacteriales bacterium]|nr:hypothetical protein [Mycobacteriales bacterium]